MPPAGSGIAGSDPVKHPSNYLTIDVEDYFQVAAFEKVIQPTSWEGFVSRVERNTGTILDLLDSHGVKGTFFIVGWTAERYPNMVRNIADRGHEIGCHSYGHQKIYNLTPDEFRQDTKKAKDILENITGLPIIGYRAPTYSITKKSLWALDILQELGFKWDSSIFPIHHDNYGIPDAPRFAYKLADHDLIEYPISTALFLGRRIPVAGGGYFRIFPYWFVKMALRKINRQEQKPFIFYLHPWEIDPGQPRIHYAGWKSRFRHYRNLEKTEKRFKRLLQDFQFRPIHNS
jgi:polysaccharide deacetylase family protein (PEP-CTERM system associated)